MEKMRFETVKEAAYAAREMFEFHEATKNREAFFAFTHESLIEESQLQSDLSDFMHANHDVLDEDYFYEYVVDALDHIIEEDNVNEDMLYDLAYEDVSVYTSDLTEWLAKNSSHIYWADEAIKEFSPDDISKILSLAQGSARATIYNGTYNVLEQFVNKDDE